MEFTASVETEEGRLAYSPPYTWPLAKPTDFDEGENSKKEEIQILLENFSGWGNPYKKLRYLK